jgi:hypothetical protein
MCLSAVSMVFFFNFGLFSPFYSVERVCLVVALLLPRLFLPRQLQVLLHLLAWTRRLCHLGILLVVFSSWWRISSTERLFIFEISAISKCKTLI